MRALLSATNCADTVTMLRKSISNAIVLYSDLSEKRFLVQFAAVGVEPIHTDSPLEALSILHARSIEGVAAFARDCDSQLDIFVPDNGNVIGMLCDSGALVRTVKEACTGPGASNLSVHHVRGVAALIASLPNQEVNEQDINVAKRLLHTPARELEAGILGYPASTTDETVGPAFIVRAIVACAALARSDVAWDSSIVISLLQLSYTWEDFEASRLFWHMYIWHLRSKYPLLSLRRRLDGLSILLDQSLWAKDLEAIALHRPEAFPLHFMKMDLDYFKAINDTLGHAAGDAFLTLSFRAVLGELGAGAIVYRRGGDEMFCILLMSNREEAIRIAERVRERVQLDLSRHLAVLQASDPACASLRSPTLSVGLSLCEKSSEVKEAIRAADVRQKNAKSLGRNRVIFEDCGSGDAEENVSPAGVL